MDLGQVSTWQTRTDEELAELLEAAEQAGMDTIMQLAMDLLEGDRADNFKQCVENFSEDEEDYVPMVAQLLAEHIAQQEHPRGHACSQ